MTELRIISREQYHAIFSDEDLPRVGDMFEANAWNSLDKISDVREVCSRLNHILNTGNYCPVCGRWNPDEHTETCASTKAKAILESIQADMKG